MTSATDSNLKHWTNINLIQSAIESGAGRGSARRFSPLNVVEVALCAAVNEFQVPVSVIRGALRGFHDFHRSAVAFYEEYHDVPLLTEPAHLALFPSSRMREIRASLHVFATRSASGERIGSSRPWSEMLSWMRHRRTHGPAAEAELASFDADRRVFESAIERSLRAAEFWAHIRTGPFNRGLPVDAWIVGKGWIHILGLFVNKHGASVELDPPPAVLRHLISEKSIVVDLPDLVVGIGTRMNAGHAVGAPWEQLGAW